MIDQVVQLREDLLANEAKVVFGPDDGKVSDRLSTPPPPPLPPNKTQKRKQPQMSGRFFFFLLNRLIYELKKK